ncbi:hypothetical protein [Brucella pituitosa]|uniref:hypothetical protein n=1 Tax=Brucella pituitosa TaxID=571256 RepID=UPI003F4ADCEA
MKKFVIALTALMALQGCYTVPDKPNFTITIERDYKEVADCAWLEFRKKSDWTRDNLDSMKRVEFSFGNSASKAGRIDVIGIGQGRTRVSSHMPVALGRWEKQHRPIFAACS